MSDGGIGLVANSTIRHTIHTAFSSSEVLTLSRHNPYFLLPLITCKIRTMTRKFFNSTVFWKGNDSLPHSMCSCSPTSSPCLNPFYSWPTTAGPLPSYPGSSAADTGLPRPATSNCRWSCGTIQHGRRRLPPSPSLTPPNRTSRIACDPIRWWLMDNTPP